MSAVQYLSVSLRFIAAPGLHKNAVPARAKGMATIEASECDEVTEQFSEMLPLLLVKISNFFCKKRERIVGQGGASPLRQRENGTSPIPVILCARQKT